MNFLRYLNLVIFFSVAHLTPGPPPASHYRNAVEQRRSILPTKTRLRTDGNGNDTWGLAGVIHMKVTVGSDKIDAFVQASMPQPSPDFVNPNKAYCLGFTFLMQEPKKDTLGAVQDSQMYRKVRTAPAEIPEGLVSLVGDINQSQLRTPWSLTFQEISDAHHYGALFPIRFMVLSLLAERYTNTPSQITKEDALLARLLLHGHCQTKLIVPDGFDPSCPPEVTVQVSYEDHLKEYASTPINIRPSIGYACWACILLGATTRMTIEACDHALALNLVLSQIAKKIPVNQCLVVIIFCDLQEALESAYIMQQILESFKVEYGDFYCTVPKELPRSEQESNLIQHQMKSLIEEADSCFSALVILLGLSRAIRNARRRNKTIPLRDLIIPLIRLPISVSSKTLSELVGVDSHSQNSPEVLVKRLRKWYQKCTYTTESTRSLCNHDWCNQIGVP